MLEMPQTQLFCSGYVKIFSLLSDLCEFFFKFLYIISISDNTNTRSFLDQLSVLCNIQSVIVDDAVKAGK